MPLGVNRVDNEELKNIIEYLNKASDYFEKMMEREENLTDSVQEEVATEPPVFDANSEKVSTGLSDEPPLGDSYFESVEIDGNSVNFEKGENANKVSILGKQGHLHGGKGVTLTNEEFKELQRRGKLLYITKLLKDADNIGTVQDTVPVEEDPVVESTELQTEATPSLDAMVAETPGVVENSVEGVKHL